MNLSQETLNTIKAEHPEAWRIKAASGIGDQLIAAAILSQVEQDAKNPPEEEALRRVNAAAGIVRVHVGRQQLAQQELLRVLEAVREQFPELDLSEVMIVLTPAGDADAEKMIKDLREELRESLQKQKTLNDSVFQAERSIAGLRSDVAEQQVKVASANSAEAAAKEEYERVCNQLKETRDLIAKFSACANIKDVRELLKTAEPQVDQTQS